MTLLRTFADGSLLEFGAGRFDRFCIYLSRPERPRYPPRDVEYFAQLKSLAARHGPQQLYADFVVIFNRTTKAVSAHVFEMIYHMTRHYGDDALELDLLYSLLYAGMVAEENKQRARLKKRVKRLGIHQLLIEDFTPEAAATFSKGKAWQVIDFECAVRQF